MTVIPKKERGKTVIHFAKNTVIFHVHICTIQILCSDTIGRQMTL